MRVLFLTHRVPYAPNRGDRIRAYHMLRYFKAQRIPVCLVALAHDDEEASAVARLSTLADEAHVVRVTWARNLVRAFLQLMTDRPMTHALLDSPQMRPVLERVRREWRPDVVLAFCSGMARFAMEPPLRSLPFVTDMVDVDSFKWESLATHVRGVRRWLYRREARVLRHFETRATRAARATLVVSPREREALRSLDAAFAPFVLPVGVDVEAFRNTGTPATRPDVVFTGVFSYEPNEHGALWLIDCVWPLVRARHPEARLSLVGMGPSRRLMARAASAGVEVTGAVEDVRPFLWRASVAVAPLATARGVQTKVLEALAAGLPVVVTSAVYEGLPEQVRPACRTADRPAEFAREIGDLLDGAASRAPVPAPEVALESLTWERSLAPLGGVLARAAG
jgi:sugar transferase (PEP-CTERM/EpsH1 system associated)